MLCGLQQKNSGTAGIIPIGSEVADATLSIIEGRLLVAQYKEVSVKKCKLLKKSKSSINKVSLNEKSGRSAFVGVFPKLFIIRGRMRTDVKTKKLHKFGGKKRP